MAERGTGQMLRELLDPTYVPQAEGAPWPEVLKVLERIAPKQVEALSKTDRHALELLTETYGTVQRAPVRKIFNETGSFWEPPSIIPTKAEWPTTKYPGRILLGTGTRKIPMYAPISYGHEAGHSLIGDIPSFSGLNSYANLSPGRAVEEGFAEGLGHSLLDIFGKRSQSWYWPNMFRKRADTPGGRSFVQGGNIGVDVGQAIRSGKPPDQMSIIDALIDIVRGNPEESFADQLKTFISKYAE